jgi:hypothetical protein
VLVTGLLILTLAGAATAQTVEGQALVLEKDVAEGTVTLDGGIVLQVDESTRIVSEDGRRILLVQLPVARRHGGGFVESEEASVRYQARRVGAALLAEEIQVGVLAPR